mmetsp:Transcript_32766/g.96597  ORF Transcript_32766/g.96597 Transcript_32766/m.96597 type:complete len:82 (+) Transcript_32766:95-340(+)
MAYNIQQFVGQIGDLELDLGIPPASRAAQAQKKTDGCVKVENRSNSSDLPVRHSAACSALRSTSTQARKHVFFFCPTSYSS